MGSTVQKQALTGGWGRTNKVSISVKQSATEKRASNVLLPYQIKWLADEAQVKVAEKSRRVGITWAEAADSALKAAAQKGMDTWYLGYNRDMALEFIETAAVWARQLNKAA
ncbi:MAG: hypothetical protein ACRETL_16185, partial [Gammaproteobacteria bacterium]